MNKEKHYIQSFELPLQFQGTVPEHVKAFTKAALGSELREAEGEAARLGLSPTVVPQAHKGEDVWGFGLWIDGKGIPFVVHVASRPEGAVDGAIRADGGKP